MNELEFHGQPLVSVVCLAYNHSKYIRQCLDGFVMQKTSFGFEVLIHDDASTDDTASIIKEYEKKYPNMIKAIYQIENQYSKGVGIGTTYLYPQAKGKYIAQCEGDDYWTDPLKLQKQADFLEAHSDYGLVYTQARVYYQDAGRYDGKTIGTQFKSFKYLLRHNHIPALTICMSRELLAKYILEMGDCLTNWCMGDYPLLLWFAANSKICFLPETTATYRVLRESASHSASFEKNENFKLSEIDVRKYFLKRYRVNKFYANKIIGKNYYKLFLYSLEHNRKDKALVYFKKARPYSFKSLKKMLAFYLSNLNPFKSLKLF